MGVVATTGLRAREPAACACDDVPRAEVGILEKTWRSDGVAMTPPAAPKSNLLRVLVQAPVLAVVTLAFALLLLVGGTIDRARFVTPLLRAWGRTCLAALGVRLVLEPAAAAELAKVRRRVLTLNHASTLDMVVVTAFWPEGGIIVMKREFLRMPVFGWVVGVIDAVPIDRTNRERAAAALDEAARVVREKDRTIIVAPEGTRSRTGELQRFKLGAFHMSQKAEAPIVPLVLHGTRELWPMGQIDCRSGTVTVRMLPEVPPPAAGQDVHPIADRLRDAYADELDRMRATVPVVGALRSSS